MRKLPLLTAVVLFALLIVGGIVSSSESGLGCGPDWPRCQGQWLPAANIHTWIEWGHRLLAGVAGILVVLTALPALRATASGRQRLLSVAALFLLTLQILLGRWIVQYDLPAPTITGHMAIGLALLNVVMALIPTKTGHREHEGAKTFPALLVWSAAGMAYLTAVLGSYTTHSGSGLACLDWPLCQEPTTAGAVSIQLLHRGAALVLGLLAVYLWLRGRMYRAPLRTLFLAPLVAYLAQGLLGALLVWSRLPPGILTLHEMTGVTVEVLFVAAALAIRTRSAESPEAIDSARPPAHP